jgi:hypothetical protein
VAPSGEGNHFIKGIMNKHIYVHILPEHLKASAGKLGIVPRKLPKTFFIYGKRVVLCIIAQK